MCANCTNYRVFEEIIYAKLKRCVLILNAKTIENLNRSGRVAGGGDIPAPGRGGGDIPVPGPGGGAGGGDIPDLGRVAGGGDIPDPGRVAGGGDIPDPGRVAGGGEIYRTSGINARLIVVLSKLLHQKFLKVT